MSFHPLILQAEKLNPNTVKGLAAVTERITITRRQGAMVPVLRGHCSSHYNNREITDGTQSLSEIPMGNYTHEWGMSQIITPVM